MPDRVVGREDKFTWSPGDVTIEPPDEGELWADPTGEHLQGKHSQKAHGAWAGRQQATQGFGTTSGATVTRDAGAAAAMQAIFGRELTDAEVAGLCGALPGAEVRVRGVPTIPGLRLEATHPDLQHEQVRMLVRQPNGAIVLHNSQFFLNADAPVGTGTRALAAQVQTAGRLGVNRIETYAVGNAAAAEAGLTNGYYTWPRLGYNAGIPDSHRLLMPPEFGRVQTLQGLMSKPGGRQWWRDNGGSILLEFDLRPGSRSRRVLGRYLEEKGYAPGE